MKTYEGRHEQRRLSDEVDLLVPGSITATPIAPTICELLPLDHEYLRGSLSTIIEVVKLTCYHLRPSRVHYYQMSAELPT